MAKRRHTPEQVINKRRETEVAIAAGSTAVRAARGRHLRPSCLPTLSPCFSEFT